MSAIKLLKWLLISLNTEKLRSASADVTCRVYANTRNILMFGKNFIVVSGKSALSDCLDHILKHLDTSLSNDLRVGRSSCHDSNGNMKYPPHSSPDSNQPASNQYKPYKPYIILNHCMRRFQSQLGRPQIILQMIPTI